MTKHVVELPSAVGTNPTYIALKDIRAVFQKGKEEGCHIILADCSSQHVHTTLSAEEVTGMWEGYLL